ncbi:MAG: lysoplasmalogenase family protein [Corynebacterium sp.]|nr:lysoplasmalogenase family protein [Corynebacterium sp.]
MKPRVIFQAVSVAATAVTVAAKIIENKKLEQVAKPLIVAPLINIKDPFMVVGGVCHIAGDIVLSRKHRKLEHGAACFALGHCVMTARQIVRGVKPQYPAAHFLVWLLAAGMIRDPKLVSYAGVLALFSSYSRSIGGPLFILSDSLIIVNKRFPHRFIDAAVIATYGSAQLKLFAPDN